MSFVYIVRVDLSLLLFLSTLITYLIQNKIYNYCLLRPGMLSCVPVFHMVPIVVYVLIHFL
jgi:hypothetical protein